MLCFYIYPFSIVFYFKSNQIILYLENILEECEEAGTGFSEEVRRTYLHELGHYLGLDEDALAARDLD